MPADVSRPSRPPKPLKARAIALLARREYSRAELRAKLGGDRSRASADAEGTANFDGNANFAEIDTLLDELAALGYLSDARFAQAMVRQKSSGYSKRAIGAL